MISERMKEVREWANLLFTFLALLGIPCLALIIHNARLETMNDVAEKYVTKEAYHADSTRTEQDRSQMQTTMGIIQGKMESIQLEQIHTSDSLAMIKDQLSNKKTQ